MICKDVFGYFMGIKNDILNDISRQVIDLRVVCQNAMNKVYRFTKNTIFVC